MKAQTRLGGGNQGPSAPGWARQHQSQRDPPFVPRKRLPDWASLELSPSVHRMSFLLSRQRGLCNSSLNYITFKPDFHLEKPFPQGLSFLTAKIFCPNASAGNGPLSNGICIGEVSRKLNG